MRVRNLSTVVAGVAALLLAATFTSSHAPVASAGTGAHRDYLDQQATRSVDAQCAAPVAQRKGAWACPAATVAEARALASEARRRASTAGAQSLAETATAGYCRVEGCWDVLSVTQAEFSGGANYGYSSTYLGHAYAFFRVTMNGASSYSNPVYFSSSRGMRYPTIEGDRLYLSNTYPQGNPVSPSAWAHYAVSGTVAAGTQVRWGTGYKSYNSTTSWASIVHEFVWHDPSSAYPGRWYFFAKSNKLQRQGSGAYWFYGGDSSLPATAAGSGWSASG